MKRSLSSCLYPLSMAFGLVDLDVRSDPPHGILVNTVELMERYGYLPCLNDSFIVVRKQGVYWTNLIRCGC